MNRLTRRDFLRNAALLSGAALLSACATQTPTPTEQPPAPEDEPTEEVEPTTEPVEEEPTEAAPTEAPPAEAVQISYASWGNEDKWASEQRCFQPFYDAHPEIEVEFIGLSWGPYWQRILTGLAGGDPVDMFRMNYWRSHAFYARGVILQLDDYFEASGVDPDELFVKIREASVYQGNWYGTPRGATGNHVIYYNRDMFDAAGIPWPEETPDWTWDDLLGIATELTSVTGDIETDVWGFDTAKITDDLNGTEEFVWGWGGTVYDEDLTKCTINSPAAIEGLQYLADLRNVHGVAPYPAQLPEGMGDAFFVQKAAMNQTGAFQINVYKNIEDFDWGIATIPAGPTEHIAYAKANATVITAASEHPDACWQLLQHINSEDVTKCEAEEGLWPPNLDGVMNSDWYLTRDTAPYDMAPAVPGRLVDARAPRLSPYANEIRNIMQNEFSPVWAGDAAVADVTPGIEEQVNEILAREELPELA